MGVDRVREGRTREWEIATLNPPQPAVASFLFFNPVNPPQLSPFVVVVFDKICPLLLHIILLLCTTKQQQQPPLDANLTATLTAAHQSYNLGRYVGCHVTWCCVLRHQAWVYVWSPSPSERCFLRSLLEVCIAPPNAGLGRYQPLRCWKRRFVPPPPALLKAVTQSMDKGAFVCNCRQ